MSDTTYKLCCIVEGENSPFSTIASSTIFVAELQKMIKKERSNLLQRVDASDLHLWKVNVDFDAVRDKIMRREYRPDANDQSQPLQTVKTIISPICEVWPEPPPHGHVHVFAGLPPGKVSPTIWPCSYRTPRRVPFYITSRAERRNKRSLDETYKLFLSRSLV